MEASKQESTVCEESSHSISGYANRFLLPAVPKMTKRGQPGANPYSMVGVCAGPEH